MILRRCNRLRTSASSLNRSCAHMQSVLARKPSRTSEEEEFIAIVQSTWEKAREIARDEGTTEASARAVLTALRIRGLAVSDADRERILTETGPMRLVRWHEKVIVATVAAELFNEQGRA